MNVIKTILTPLTDANNLAPVSFCVAVGFIVAAILGYPSALGYICGTLGVLFMFPAMFADKFAEILDKKLNK